MLAIPYSEAGAMERTKSSDFSTRRKNLPRL
jgi:hypothetical protein